MRFGLLVLGLFVSSISFAEMDDASRNALIDKLHLVQSGLATQDASKVAVTLRLADLLSERARLATMRELDSGCQVCTAGREDRTRAIKLYQDVLARVTPEQKGRVLIQVGHLLQLQGQDAQSMDYYAKVSATDDVLVKAEAKLSIAEILFRQHAFSKAEPYYREVVATPEAASRGLAAYRLAWCAYNLGQIESAKIQLISMLRTPELLSRQANRREIDKSFQEEISIDLTTFMARLPITELDLKLLQEVSPEPAKVSNLSVLAVEAGRIGRKEDSLRVWQYVVSQLKDTDQKYNAFVYMSQFSFDMNKKSEALEYFKQAATIRAQMKVCEGQCAETDVRLRNLLIAWNKIEKLSPTPILAEAYTTFQKHFPSDAEVHFWSAGVHSELKMWDLAWSSATDAMNGYKDDAKKLESVLLYRLELAELAKRSDWLTNAQESYILLSRDKTRLVDVRYQKAQAAYDAGKYDASSQEMRALALDINVPMKLRKQAADMALDSLVLLKSDAQLIAWSRDFAGAFKGEDRKDFVKVEQKAILTRAANLSEKTPEEAFIVLNEFKVEGADPADLQIFLKNKILLAEKLNRFADARFATDEFLKLATLSPADREFGLGKKAQFADLTLDFPSSLSALEKMKMEKVKPDQRLLKLALYSQLAGSSPEKYFRDYLKTAKVDSVSTGIAFELVKMSADPAKEISLQHKFLESQPSVLESAYLFALTKDSSPKLIAKIRAEKSLTTTSLGKLVARSFVLTDYKALQAKISSHALSTKTQRTLTTSIKARGALLDAVEKFANQAIQGGDWLTQLLAIHLVSQESDRFYQELMSLPMPSELTEDEQAQYMNILSQQAAPYQSKSAQAKQKVEEFWAQSEWKDAYQKSLNQAGGREMILREIEMLTEIAPEGQKANLVSLQSTQATSRVAAQVPPADAIELKRAKVRSEPFNVSALKDLLTLEKQAQNHAMVQYLEQRISGGLNE